MHFLYSLFLGAGIVIAAWFGHPNHAVVAQPVQPASKVVVIATSTIITTSKIEKIATSIKNTVKQGPKDMPVLSDLNIYHPDIVLSPQLVAAPRYVAALPSSGKACVSWSEPQNERPLRYELYTRLSSEPYFVKFASTQKNFYKTSYEFASTNKLEDIIRLYKIIAVYADGSESEFSEPTQDGFMYEGQNCDTVGTQLLHELSKAQTTPDLTYLGNNQHGPFLTSHTSELEVGIKCCGVSNLIDSAGHFMGIRNDKTVDNTFPAGAEMNLVGYSNTYKIPNPSLGEYTLTIRGDENDKEVSIAYINNKGYVNRTFNVFQHANSELKFKFTLVK